MAEIYGMSRRADEPVHLFVIRKLGGKFFRQDFIKTHIVITGTGHHREITQHQEPLLVFPGRYRLKIILSDNKIQFQIFHIFVKNVFDGFHGVRFSGA